MSFRFNDPEAEEMRAALDAFEQENPGVKVELQTIAWGESRQQFLREAAVGEGPDVVHIAFVWPRDMGAAGALLPLNDFLETHADPGRIRRLHRDRPLGRAGRQHLRRPVDDGYLGDGLSHRRAGSGRRQRRSRAPGTRCAKRARAIHEKTGKVGFGFPGGSGPSNTIWFLANYYWWSNGSALVVADGDGFATGITVEQIAEAMAYYDSFFKEGHNPESMLGRHELVRPRHPRGHDER